MQWLRLQFALHCSLFAVYLYIHVHKLKDFIVPHCVKEWMTINKQDTLLKYHFYFKIIVTAYEFKRVKAAYATRGSSLSEKWARIGGAVYTAQTGWRLPSTENPHLHFKARSQPQKPLQIKFGLQINTMLSDDVLKVSVHLLPSHDT